MYFQTQPHVKKQLSEQPTIADTAVVLDSHLGQWTEVGEGTKIVESRLDDYSYVVNNSDIIYSQIGKFVNIAAFVRLNPGQHPMGRASMHHFQYRSEAYDMGDDDADFFDWRRSSPVRVDHDVWIGHGAIVKGGVHIGTGSVIGSGAVVTKDVAPYSIVAGVPATEIRPRFEIPTQEALLRIKWWDWTHDLLKDRLKDFRMLAIDKFCLKYDPEL